MLIAPTLDPVSIETTRRHLPATPALDALDELEWPWRALDEQPGSLDRQRVVVSPIGRFDWIRACAATVARPWPIRVFAHWQDDSLAAVAPFVRQRRGAIEHLVHLGVDRIIEPMDVAYCDEDALAHLADQLSKSRQPLVFDRIPADSPTIGALRKAFGKRALFVSGPRSSCPYIPLDASWEEPEKNLKSGRRSDFRRARRKAEEQGEVKTQVLAPAEDELDSLVDLAFEIEAASWKRDTGTALACDLARAEFYREYARAACRQGILRLCFLYIGEQPVAMQFAIESGGGFWLLKIGYDARFSGCSPGILLLRDTIQYAARAGLTSYEFLGSADAWTGTWTKHERACVSLRVYPVGFRGLTAFTLEVASVLGRRLKTKARRAPVASSDPAR